MASLKGQLWHIHKSWCNGGVQNKDFGVALQTVLSVTALLIQFLFGF